jgi:5'-nucleotidase
MKLLLTNDDGIDAPGLAALREAALQIGEPVVVAPAEHQSGCSHRVTTGQPLRVVRHGPGSYAVAGTPADCIRVGLGHLAPETTWVLSGINAGGNLGADVWHSGTVAAVREAVLHGWPGVARSHYLKRGQPVDWGRAAAWVVAVLRDLMARPWQAGQFWNVNLPHLAGGSDVPPVVFCPLDPSPLPIDFRQDGDLWQYAGDYHARRRVPGSDVDVCFGDQIAVTRLSLF